MEEQKKWSKTKFRKFLTKLLEQGNVSQKHIDIFLKRENIKKFKVAFTHSSMKEDEDYEIYEFTGDPIINSYITFYIRRKFPKIVHVKWYNRLKSYLISDRVFAKVAMKEGLADFVRYGEEMDYLRKNPDLDEKEEYMKMMEDVLEAFFGCLSEIVVDSGKEHGVAVAVCDAIIKPWLDNIKIPLAYDELFDPVSILKELYESKKIGLLWPNDQTYLFEKKEGQVPEYTAYVYGWPKGNRVSSYKNKHEAMEVMKRRGEYTEIPPHVMNKFIQTHDKNKVLLATAKSKNKKEAKMKAAKEALAILKNKYNIKATHDDPYKKKKYDPARTALFKSRVLLE